MVQPCGLGTGVLATGLAMGLEPQVGTGASVGTNAPAHHRVCSCHPGAERADCHAFSRIRSCLWIWSTHDGHPPRKTGRFTGADFPLQPDGTLRCPAGSTLTLQERRQEADGGLRLVYAASIRNCRPCPLREQCQWNGSATAKPRQVSVLLHPLVVAPEPILWKDWSRRHHRRACMYLLHHQRVDIQMASGCLLPSTSTPPILSRTRRAHFRLSWAEHLKRNVRKASEGQVKITQIAST